MAKQPHHWRFRIAAFHILDSLLHIKYTLLKIVFNKILSLCKTLHLKDYDSFLTITLNWSSLFLIKIRWHSGPMMQTHQDAEYFIIWYFRVTMAFNVAGRPDISDISGVCTENVLLEYNGWYEVQEHLSAKNTAMIGLIGEDLYVFIFGAVTENCMADLACDQHCRRCEEQGVQWNHLLKAN